MNDGCSSIYDPTQFINKVAFDEIINNESNRAMKMNYDMNKLIHELGLSDDSSFGAKYEIGVIIDELNKKNVDINNVRNHVTTLFNTPELQDIINTKYNSDKVREYNDWLNDENSDNSVFIAHKTNNEVHTYTCPSISELDEALNSIYKFLSE